MSRPPSCSTARLDRSLHRRPAGDVRRQREGPPAGGPDGPRHRLGRGVVQVEHGHRRPARGQLPAGGLADPPAAPGDQGDRPGERAAGGRGPTASIPPRAPSCGSSPRCSCGTSLPAAPDAPDVPGRGYSTGRTQRPPAGRPRCAQLARDLHLEPHASAGSDRPSGGQLRPPPDGGRRRGRRRHGAGAGGGGRARARHRGAGATAGAVVRPDGSGRPAPRRRYGGPSPAFDTWRHRLAGAAAAADDPLAAVARGGAVLPGLRLAPPASPWCPCCGPGVPLGRSD